MTPHNPASDPALFAARRALAAPGYATLAEVGLDLDLVSPYQLSCGHPEGPVLVSYNFLDAPAARAHRAALARAGYLPEMRFNRVVDAALASAGLTRSALYLTHACHLLPPTRSHSVPARLLEASFDAVTRHEIAGRPVIALGRAAAQTCRRFGVAHLEVPHPSARGETDAARAGRLAIALRAVHRQAGRAA
ncbi:uracil-DNA glycosylase family protein [Roseivivax sp. CAU 1761]